MTGKGKNDRQVVRSKAVDEETIQMARQHVLNCSARFCESFFLRNDGFAIVAQFYGHLLLFFAPILGEIPESKPLRVR